MGHISRAFANEVAPIIFSCSLQKTSLNEPRMKSIGASVLEMQLDLCRAGRGSGWGGGRGQKGI